MSDATRRGLRTLLQASFAAALIALLRSFDLVAWTPEQTAAVMAVLTPLLAFGQNALEDAAPALPALFKAPPSAGGGGQSPPPEPDRQVQARS